MSHYTGSVPATRRPTDWRDAAACKDAPDAMFPSSNTNEIEYAKSYCRRCPAINRCLQWALDTKQAHGVWGGLTEDERHTLRRSQRGRTTPEDAAAQAENTRQPHSERTLHNLFQDNTVRVDGGHLEWTGTPYPGFNGRYYTPKKIAFIIDRGREPVGPVKVGCTNRECVLPAHLTDHTERGVCGTRPGYQRHRKEGTEICGPCRQANTDANNRLLRTGTTKVAV